MWAITEPEVKEKYLALLAEEKEIRKRHNVTGISSAEMEYLGHKYAIIRERLEVYQEFIRPEILETWKKSQS